MSTFAKHVVVASDQEAGSVICNENIFTWFSRICEQMLMKALHDYEFLPHMFARLYTTREVFYSTC